MKLRTTFLCLSLTLISCTKKSDDLSQQLVKPLNDDQVILEYNGGTITAGDVKDEMKPQFERIREQLLNAYTRAAEEKLVEKMADRFKADDVKVSDAELESYIRANNIPRGEADKVRGFLISEKKRIQKQTSQNSVFQSLNVSNKLGAARYDVEATSDMPQQGPSGADVTIQVFCDFANPMCNRSRLTMGEMKNEFGDKIRWIFRHFPVPSNPAGYEASLVAMCAHEQDKFWPVHDALFDHQATLAKDDLTEIAVKAGANEKELKNCINSEVARNNLNKEIKAATSLGLTATPAYFVNGNKVNDFEKLKPTVRTLLKK